MSLKLREIINAFAEKNPNFFRNPKGQIIEQTDDGSERPTGFYQNDEGEFFEEEAWFEVVAEEKERIRKENESKMQKWQEEQAILLKQQQELINHPRKQDNKKNHKPIIFATLVLILLIVSIIWFVMPFGAEENTQLITEAPIEVESEPEIPEIFGNATITGDGVNIRKEPTLQGQIVGNVPEAGEYVQILLKPADIKEWIKIARKNKDSGWVYYKYVNDSI